jgi:hypothetical protein
MPRRALALSVSRALKTAYLNGLEAIETLCCKPMGTQLDPFCIRLTGML